MQVSQFQLLLNEKKAESMGLQSIVVKDLVIKYKDLIAVDKVSFRLDSGLILLLGPNGSGKSSIIKALLGLIKPWRGSVSILGCNPTDTNCIKDRIHVVFEETTLPFHLKVKEYLEGIAFLREDEENIDKVIDFFGLRHHLNKRIGELSKGLRRRVSIASLFLGKADILIMDEPYNGLDIEACIRVNKIIDETKAKNPNILILLSTHIIPPLIPNKIIVLRNGRLLYFGDPPTNKAYVKVRYKGQELELELSEFNRVIQEVLDGNISIIDVRQHTLHDFIESIIFGKS